MVKRPTEEESYIIMNSEEASRKKTVTEKVFLFILKVSKHNNQLRTMTCQPTAGLISICPQKKGNDQPVSLGVIIQLLAF